MSAGLRMVVYSPVGEVSSIVGLVDRRAVFSANCDQPYAEPKFFILVSFESFCGHSIDRSWAMGSLVIFCEKF